ncbi:MAG: hypothetical protein ACO3JL_19900, partial [Myxococcota bacterium]
RVVKNNVWTATPDFPIGAGGALAQNEDAVWWVNPVDATGYGVWRFDKASLRWSQVSDSFPEGDASAYDFQGGAAVVYDDHIHYIADNVLFLFDVRTQTWSRSKTLPYGLRRERTPLVYDDKLWVKTPGMFWVYDPTTQEQRYISELGDLADGIAFEVNGRLVFGAGRNLYADWRQPASWNRYFVAWDPVTEESEDYVLELPELHFTQVLDLGETTIFLTNDGPNFVLDEASGAVSELNVNPTLACIQPSSGERHGAWKGAALAFDGVGLVVGGEFDTGLGVLQKRGAMLYFP